MSSREQILAAAKQNTLKRYNKPDYTELEKQALTFDNKIEKFCEMMKAVGGQVAVLEEGQDINDVIKAHFPDAKRIATNLKEVTCLGQPQAITCATFHPDDVEKPGELNGTDLAILQGHLGVCENAAVWVKQDMEQRTIFFISEAIVLIVDRNTLVNNMHEAYKKVETGDMGYATFISGPSKTADIEQALVMGAHGARVALAILV